MQTLTPETTTWQPSTAGAWDRAVVVVYRDDDGAHRYPVAYPAARADAARIRDAYRAAGDDVEVWRRDTEAGTWTPEDLPAAVPVRRGLRGVLVDVIGAEVLARLTDVGADPDASEVVRADVLAEVLTAARDILGVSEVPAAQPVRAVRPSAGAAARALAAQHPEWTARQIAREVGKSERQVRRYLAA